MHLIVVVFISARQGNVLGGQKCTHQNLGKKLLLKVISYKSYFLSNKDQRCCRKTCMFLCNLRRSNRQVLQQGNFVMVSKVF